ncbi:MULTISPECIES: signal peptidase I SipW [Bacillus]|uniref:Signal peptidase I n=1 Tax=Bacillus halotolerans TaxID=260554 RepID=A0A9Q6A640_9BACI|nr:MULTISPECIES: signal peptidase I [Bacillus]PLS04991.1 signal peptidase I [Bacillus halotolerans]QNH41438.1 signal peptidase I [Bacillus sp. PAMC26543]
MKKALKLISNILYVIIFTLIIVLTLVVISTRSSGGEPAVFGYTLKSVLSGSMDPEFKTGSLILVKEITDVKRLQKGDVITFMQDADTAVTHRIIDMKKQGDHLSFQTKGDNNAAADSAPVSDENVRAQYTGFQLPYAGYMLHFASQPIGTAILLIVPGVMLLIYSFVTISSAIREIERKTKALETETKDNTMST